MVKIILKRSHIGITPKQQLILQALGLKKIGSTVKRAESKATMGMINKVSHLVSFEKVDE
jgi:large subunit ribosomal protein L30